MTPRVILVSIDGLAAFYREDAMVRMPTLRALAERGVVAGRMETVFPSTTWPTHVSLVTGVRPARHGVVGNSILNRRTATREDLTGDPVYDAPDLLRVPTVYDRAHAAGLRTAAIDWPCTRNARSLGFNLPFFKDQRVFETQTAPAVWKELGALGYPLDRQGAWAELPKRFLKDAMVADVAAHVLHRHTPDLLLVHFLCVDSLQHLHGPRSPEARWAIEYVDALLGRLLASLPGGGLGDRTALFVVSDHGFFPVEREVRINVWLHREGLAEEARFVMNHGAGYLYALGAGDSAPLLGDLARALAGVEGVDVVWAASQYASLGLPTPAEHPHVGDLLLEAAPGSYFADEAMGDAVVGPPRYRGTHGQRAHHPDNGAFFLAAGRGIVRGRVLTEITSRDVAPTIAALLGLAPAEAEGRILAEILDV